MSSLEFVRRTHVKTPHGHCVEYVDVYREKEDGSLRLVIPAGNQVYSIREDSPSGSLYAAAFASWTDDGIRYVSRRYSEATVQQWEQEARAFSRVEPREVALQRLIAELDRI